MEVPDLYETTKDCLHCSMSFPTNKVRTKSVKTITYDTDFMPNYKEGTVDAYYYSVYVCEFCGFSFTDDYTKYFAPGTKEEILLKVSNNWMPHSFNGERSANQAIAAFKLALLCADIKKEKHVAQAGLALRIAWTYRKLKNEEQEKRFLKIACDQYGKSYSTNDYSSTQMSETRILYMIAELSLRTDDYLTARKFFSKVIESQKNGGEAKVIDMAKDRWATMREEKAEI